MGSLYILLPNPDGSERPAAVMEYSGTPPVIGFSQPGVRAVQNFNNLPSDAQKLLGIMSVRLAMGPVPVPAQDLLNPPQWGPIGGPANNWYFDFENGYPAGASNALDILCGSYTNLPTIGSKFVMGPALWESPYTVRRFASRQPRDARFMTLWIDPPLRRAVSSFVDTAYFWNP